MDSWYHEAGVAPFASFPGSLPFSSHSSFPSYRPGRGESVWSYDSSCIPYLLCLPLIFFIPLSLLLISPRLIVRYTDPPFEPH